MEYIKKKIASWEVKYGQIGLSGKDNILARELFKNYFGKTFTLSTFKGDFSDVNFNEKTLSSAVRLSCRGFFKQLAPNDIIYLIPKEDNLVIISNSEPDQKLEKNLEGSKRSKFSDKELLEIIAQLTKENQQLRDTNSSLFQYKERLEKYEGLDKIFNDEKFMETWLERNIHKAVPDLEIIERQPSIAWPKSGLRNRLDFFCLDRTTRELVIVENKVRHNRRTLETQYLSYKAWVHDNIDLINDKYKALNLNATINFKFVIITDTTDERLENICNHNNIALILIDGGVIFEEIVPY
jgi:hypothetical protein